MPQSESIANRVLALSVPEPMSGCWLWLAAVDKDGYGLMKISPKMVRAHRASYTAFIGPIPAGAELDHRCRVRCCVNPQHLEPVSTKENQYRSPISLSTQALTKTHCPKGHPYSGSNLYHWKRNNRRICKECKRQYTRALYARKRAKQ